MAHPRDLGDRRPFTTAGDKFGSQVGFEGFGVHALRIARLCYEHKQHIATPTGNTRGMGKKPINAVLADNLAHFMREKEFTQASLAKLSGVGQTTISLYLRPDARQPSATGKLPSAKLAEVESLASALGVEIWELLRPRIAAELPGYDRLTKADQANIEQTLSTLIAGKLASYETEKKADKLPSSQTIEFELDSDTMGNLEAALEMAEQAVHGRVPHGKHARKRGGQSR